MAISGHPCYVVLQTKHKQVGEWVVIDNAHMYKQSSSAQHSDGTLRGGARGGDSVQRGGAPTRVAIRGTHPRIRPREAKPYRRAVSKMAATSESINSTGVQADD